MYGCSTSTVFCAVSTLEKQILPWGTPSGGGGEMGSCLLVNQYFVTKYSLGLHIPLWSAYVIDGNVRMCNFILHIVLTCLNDLRFSFRGHRDQRIKAQ